MNLHDPNTEKQISRIAERSLAGQPFERRFSKWWTLQLPDWVLTTLVVLFFSILFFASSAIPQYRNMVCAMLGMLAIRAGISSLVFTAQKCELHTTLVNLPARRQLAFGYVRSRFLRKFWLIAFVYSAAIAFGLYGLDVLKALTSFFLSFGIIIGTVSFSNTRWFARSHIQKLWYLTGSILGLALFYLFIKDFEKGVLGSMEPWIDLMLWVLPPAWISPGKIDSGGLFLAILWICLGIWSWVRWPSTLSPGYDRPGDFATDRGMSASYETFEDSETTTTPEALDYPDELASDSGNGWVNRLVMKSIPAGEIAIARAILEAGKGWAKHVHLFLLLAPIWLLACWIFREHIPSDEAGDLIVIAEWLVPITYIVLTIFPYSNSIPRATNPYPLGSGHVPFFTTLPVSIRNLLSISQRVTIVRSVIFGLLSTPFFWALAVINEVPDVAAGLLGGIPTFTVIWCVSRPVFIWHRIQAATKCKRGVFFIRCATASVEVILFFLWLLASFCAVAAGFVWASERTSALLIPGAVGAFVLSAIFSRVLLEIAINEIRHRRYDWVSKPG